MIIQGHSKSVSQLVTRSYSIAKMTARFANIWVLWKFYVSAKSADDCATISTLQSYHIRWWNYFRSVPTNVITVPKRYRWTDRRTIYCHVLLWHHRAVKLGRQNVTDIIGIADI